MTNELHTPFDRGRLDRELQDMLLEDGKAVFHALNCPLCDSRDLALTALALAGWEEEEFIHAAWERYISNDQA